MNPWPGAFFDHGGEQLRVLEAEPAEATSGPPGTVLDAAPTIACGQNTALRLLRLQRAGRAPMAADAFLRGYALPPGTVLPSPT
jgi:methionyl-tRNA formyltransferase